MMRTWSARRRLGLLAGVGLATLMFAAAAQAQTQDPLVDLLVKKGLITAEDAAKVTPGSRGEREALVKLLEAKGLLTADDVASLGPAPPIEEIPGAPPNETPVYAHNDHPTTFSVGPVDVAFSGFIDNQTIFRTKNEGTVGTNFFNIPFSNTISGNTGETRDTLQNSRLAVKTESHFSLAGEDVDAAAYVEADFLGNDAANIEVTSNSHTFRLRQAFVDARMGQWELVAGQAWGWLTPNRQGLGSYPSDVFITDDYDTNYNVGLTWTRQPVVRAIWHPNDQWAMGLSVENPEQFGGQGETTFPTFFNAQVAGQIDQGAGGTSIPNAAPDLVPKIAYDGAIGDHKLHVEATGLVSFFQVTDLPVFGGTTFVRHTATGYGGELAGNLELVPGLTAFAGGYASSGGGRYIFGMAPDLVVLPNAAGTDVFISPVKSYAGLFGLEWKATDRFKLSGYWGFMDATRDFALDTTPGAKPGTFIGFGGPFSANNNNRWINEASLDGTYVIWTDPRYGALQTGLQYSYMEREPWFVAKGAPANASLHQVWWDFRYILP
jgi:hypothetical protein